uniref:Phospholipid phosphatase 4 n=1 Tax=Gasterosteus aculeatus aculeatus TaxID=481459 RepID=A0AAQ4PCC4_GASAC
MNVSPPDRGKNVRELALEIAVRVLLFGVFVFTEFLEPFERVIQPEELWLYKNPLVESDHIPKRVMFTKARLFPSLLPRRTSECKDAVHRGARYGLRGTQELPQQPFLLCILWPRLHLLLPGGEAAVFYGSRSRTQLASLCHGAASLQCHDDRLVPDLRLQTPLARRLCRRSGRLALCVRLLSPALPALSALGLPHVLRQPGCRRPRALAPRGRPAAHGQHNQSSPGGPE